ncbi:hypothetical protein [Nocardia brasiliensis]|uniref:DNA primase/polymerase bifunctional N-terminal domain-containing protein n=1 Tax=Nocardia brasiliensis (strain ATCC 700358 / HUJEG-1) TaxID=1133849 RepID=K0F8P8_NOCB7|nr:hypothetical protein [Nocardia brasiliensis]AFU06114.1 hypothetical protein O3I_040845 [Nocardia brasiliensis ATCC 700358]OCF88685.1 hypothetical protein AW168_20460 [Nocardia brasiliensis]
MNIVPNTERCHSSHEIAHRLRHLYGLPVQLLGGRPVVTTGSVLGAVAMPPDLGRTVLAALERTYAAPVIADPGEHTWIFLVAPPSPARPVEVLVRRYLAGHQVTVLPGGHHIMLPTSDCARGWHWAGEPAPGVLRMPPRTAVLDAVQQMTTRHSGTA